jgi:hypothetical protein
MGVKHQRRRHPGPGFKLTHYPTFEAENFEANASIYHATSRAKRKNPVSNAGTTRMTA